MRQGSCAAVIGTALALSCNGGANPGGTGGNTALFLPTEGSRLKIEWAEGPGGQRSTRSLYDTQLKTECFFARAADGEIRCLPRALAVANDFADPACSARAVVSFSEACVPQKFVIRPDTSNACQTRNRVYGLGARIPEGGLYWRPTATECLEGGTLPDAVAYRLGEELPAAMFVKAAIAPEPSRAAGEAVAMLLATAEDGTRDSIGWRNTATMSDCFVYTLGDNREHCMPVAAGVTTTTFGDATCQEPVAGFDGGCSPHPTMARKFDTSTCPITSNMVALGARVDSVFLRRSTDNVCAAFAPAVGAEFHTLGEVIAPDTFPTFDLKVEDSQARVRRQTLVSPNGRQIGSNWFDSTRNVACAPVLSDGKALCLPPGSFTFQFEDAACTRPVWRAARGTCPPPYAFRSVPGSCPARRLVYELGPAYAGSVFALTLMRDENGAVEDCGPATVAPGDQVFSLTPVADTEFAELKMIDPP